MKIQFSGGLPYMLASTLFFSGMNLLIKTVSHLPTAELVFVRCGIALLICIAELKNRKVPLVGKNKGLLFARGLFGTIAVFTFFYSLSGLPLGTAVTIQYLSPIFTSILAIFMLRENIKIPQWIFYLISFSGVYWMQGESASEKNALLIAFGLLSAFCSGLAYNTVRKLSGLEDPIVVVLHFQILGTLAGAFFCLFDWITPSASDWLCLSGIGLLTYLGQKNLTLALQKEKIGDISIFNYLGIAYALVFGYFFFGEIPDKRAIAGITLVLAGVVLNFLYIKMYQTKKAAAL